MKTHRFLCSVRFQLQYPCIFLPIYLFPLKNEKKKYQTNKSPLFHSSWFLTCNVQNEILVQTHVPLVFCRFKEYLMYCFYKNQSNVAYTASIWRLLSRSFMSYYLCKQWADLDAGIVDCMYSFLVYNLFCSAPGDRSLSDVSTYRKENILLVLVYRSHVRNWVSMFDNTYTFTLNGHKKQKIKTIN